VVTPPGIAALSPSLEASARLHHSNGLDALSRSLGRDALAAEVSSRAADPEEALKTIQWAIAGWWSRHLVGGDLRDPSLRTLPPQHGQSTPLRSARWLVIILFRHRYSPRG